MTSSLDRFFNFEALPLGFYACLLLIVGCGGGIVTTHPAPARPPQNTATVAISAPTLRLMGGQLITFTAAVTGELGGVVEWTGNGNLGGTGAVGFISSDGAYTAPAR